MCSMGKKAGIKLCLIKCILVRAGRGYQSRNNPSIAVGNPLYFLDLKKTKKLLLSDLNGSIANVHVEFIFSVFKFQVLSVESQSLYIQRFKLAYKPSLSNL